MILVTGATGHIGSELVRLLSGNGASVRAVTRDPQRAQHLPGVDWVKGDLGEAGSLASLFRGADRMFLLTSNSEDMRTLQVNAIRAARAAGVAHVVKVSALGASDHSKSPIGRAHYEAESALQESGMAWRSPSRRRGNGSFGPGRRHGLSRACLPWPPISVREGRPR